MEQAHQLPRLTLGAVFPLSRPKYLDPIPPPTYPFTSPSWCLPHKPRSISILDVFKNHELLATYTVDQKPIYLIGRNAVVCDIVMNHCSISRLHAAVIHHMDGSTYLIDLGSCHGTSVDDVPLKALQPTLIIHGSMLKFGASTRSYSFKSFESKDQIVEMVEARIGLESDEVELQQNTMMNRALSYRLGFSIPLTHKTETVDAQGDDRMSMYSVRQIEGPQSMCVSMRRTQSEDNTIAGAFPTSPNPSSAPHPPPVLMMVRGREEPGRKRSRTQSAGLASALHSGLERSGSTSQLLAETVSENVSMDHDAAMPKRVHFDAQPPIAIPPPSVSSEHHEDEQEEEEGEQMQDDAPVHVVVQEGLVPPVMSSLPPHNLHFDDDL